MKTKRFIAADMRTAMNRVRAEHGADAVIVSQRAIPGGVELVAAAHYEPPASTAAQRARQSKTRPAIARTPAAAALARANIGGKGRTTVRLPAFSIAKPSNSEKTPVTADSVATATSFATLPADDAPIVPAFGRPSPAHATATTATSVATAPLTAVPSSASAEPAASHLELTHLRLEITRMRRLIETQMEQLNEQRLRGNPARQQALECLENWGFSATSAHALAGQIPASLEAADVRQSLRNHLAQTVPVVDATTLQDGGIIAAVGPSGAGKTTTIAKLAGHFLRQHSARDIALVSVCAPTDYPQASTPLLHAFGRQLGLAVHEVGNVSELALLLARLADYKWVLIDSARPVATDRPLPGSLQWLKTLSRIYTLLVLPATSGLPEMQETVRRFSRMRPQGLVLTRWDESCRPGAALSVAMEQHLPLAWLSDGAADPSSLHRAVVSEVLQRLEDLPAAADNPNQAQAEMMTSPLMKSDTMEWPHAAAA